MQYQQLTGGLTTVRESVQSGHFESFCAILGNFSAKRAKQFKEKCCFQRLRIIHAE